MKRRISVLAVTVFLVTLSFAQQDTNYEKTIEELKHSTPNVIDTGKTLELQFMKKNWTVKKGCEILIYLPAAGHTDYMFIKPKRSVLNTKLLGKVADVVSSGALAIGLGSGSMDNVIGVIQKANAVSYGADALERVEDLKISSKAKKIAGKKATVLHWKSVDDEYLLYVKIGKKKYQITYASAILVNEIKLTKSNNYDF